MAWVALILAPLTFAVTAVYIVLMTRSGGLSSPNARSMHKIPKPAGAGLIAMVLVLGGWWIVGVRPDKTSISLTIGALVLSVIGWIDDQRPVPAALRFGAQMAAITACLAALPGEARVLPFLPIFAERCLEALAWGWFVNLFNFMDGIDGLAGSEAVFVAVGYLAIAGSMVAAAPLSMMIVGAMLGYLAWNWAPSRVMMGDAGSIPLGFILGWMMLDLAFRGELLAAIILPLYFCLDASITLTRRLLRGKLPYEGHREHFYQRAALGCGSHATVAISVLAANVGLLFAALLSVTHPIQGGFMAVTVMTALLAGLRRLAQGNPQAA